MRKFLKQLRPAIMLIALAMITLILHRMGLDFKLTILQETITLFDIGQVLFCMGGVTIIFVIIINRLQAKEETE